MSSYLGNIPSNNFVSLKRQVITGNGGSTYTLDHSVASVNDVAIFVNNVRQDPASYSISTTSLTLGGTISSSDSCYVLFLGQALQTVTPDANTITNAMIQDGTIAESKLASGVNTIQMAESWRLTTSSNIGVNGDVTSNWEVVDNNSYSSLGTGLTESSGIFSFPQTGIYFVFFMSAIYTQAGDNTVRFELHTTIDNSTYATVAAVREGNASSTNHQKGGANSTIIDVTDTSLVKFKFRTESFNSSSNLQGETTNTRTGFTIIRIGDT